jgi:hypothetical protein
VSFTDVDVVDGVVGGVVVSASIAVVAAFVAVAFVVAASAALAHGSVLSDIKGVDSSVIVVMKLFVIDSCERFGLCER